MIGPSGATSGVMITQRTVVRDSSENQRRVLGTVDRLVCERFAADTWRYVVAGVARKGCY